MNIILYHKHYDPEHLNYVKNIMIKRGHPIIRAIWSEMYGLWLAVEGCHRLRACKALGLTPIIKDISKQKTVTIQYLGIQTKFNVTDLLIYLQDSANSSEFLFFENEKN